MPQFEYQGYNVSGKALKGSVVSDNVASAKIELKQKGIFPSSLREIKTQRTAANADRGFQFQSPFKRIKSEDIANMTRQLATLVGASIPLIESLDALVDQVENEQLRGAISDVKRDVREGSPLHSALGRFPNIFTNLYVSMVESGEASGTLDLVLLRLADFLEYQDRLTKKVKSALTYPVLMIIVAFAALFFIFTTVIPEIEQVFKENKQTLPMITQVVLWMSRALIAYWWAVFSVLIVTVIAVRKYLKSESGTRWWDATKLKLPIVGEMVRMVAISRFAKTLSTLLTSGITLLLSLGVVKNVVGNITMREAIEKATTDLTEGASISRPLKNSGQFPPMVTHMISVGERTGELESMLEKVSEHYEYQVDSRIQNLTALLEPVMILVLAGIVLVIILSVVLPMLEMNNAVL